MKRVAAIVVASLLLAASSGLALADLSSPPRATIDNNTEFKVQPAGLDPVVVNDAENEKYKVCDMDKKNPPPKCQPLSP